MLRKSVILLVLATTLSACGAQRVTSVAAPTVVQAQSNSGVKKAVKVGAEATFVYMDTNRDGALTAAESRFPAAEQAKLDRNRDGLIQPKEFITWVVNKSGEVASMRKYAAEMFASEDKNRDGFVDQIEFAPMTHTGMVHFTTFTLSDTNHDRRLTRSEFEDMVAWTKSSMGDFQNVPIPPPVPFKPPAPVPPVANPNGDYGSGGGSLEPVPGQP